ncbi:holo-ACP synthase [Paenibacillus xanthanilyticus]|uniref:Holo-[acyl-carrier-protein] synthase n=1 Tax=Paenibacillus xanthanilyticus TaxID=1783531 RepID=A0ABV8K8J6_9BACL
MIIGIGHDMASLTRVASILDGEIGEKFLRRILTPGERETIAGLGGLRRTEYAAGRFAAKEALSKALGCGIGGELSFQDMEIGRDASGKPGAALSAAAWDRLGRDAARTRIHVTITHEQPFASAFVVVEEV